MRYHFALAAFIAIASTVHAEEISVSEEDAAEVSDEVGSAIEDFLRNDAVGVPFGMSDSGNFVIDGLGIVSPTSGVTIVRPHIGSPDWTPSVRDCFVKALLDKCDWESP